MNDKKNPPVYANKADWPKWLTRKEASAYLWAEHGVGVAPATLATMAAATRGGGPKFKKSYGKSVYARSDLDQWAAERQPEAPVVTKTPKDADEGRLKVRWVYPLELAEEIKLWGQLVDG
jgi:hypothetical protein